MVEGQFRQVSKPSPSCTETPVHTSDIGACRTSFLHSRLDRQQAKSLADDRERRLIFIHANHGLKDAYSTVLDSLPSDIPELATVPRRQVMEQEEAEDEPPLPEL